MEAEVVLLPSFLRGRTRPLLCILAGTLTTLVARPSALARPTERLTRYSPSIQAQIVSFRKLSRAEDINQGQRHFPKKGGRRNM